MNKDYIQAIPDAERRFINATDGHVCRDGDGDDSPINGYALKFNRDTRIGNWFIERIMPGACDDVMDDDVRCLFNHDPNLILARSVNGSGTLTLTVDDTGLKYSYITPDRTYARDLENAIDSGDITGSSFAFRVESETWIDNGPDELPIREINKLSRLFDVAPVTYPAYQDTTVGKRSLDAWRTETATGTDVVDPIQVDPKEKKELPKRLTARKAKFINNKYLANHEKKQ